MVVLQSDRKQIAVLASPPTRGRLFTPAQKNRARKIMKKETQGSLYCRCGREKIRANGHCATCYTLRRYDTQHFGGLREQVLERDGYCCRVCGASGRDKRSIVVHHRLPGKSLLRLMVSLCPACHAKVHHTKAVMAPLPPFLLELWREQHPEGHEQIALDFRSQEPSALPVPLFAEETAGINQLA